MSLQIKFELSQTDLDHFCEAMKRSRESSADIPSQEIIENTKLLLKQIQRSDAKDFIRQRIGQLATLISMLEDTAWHLAEDDRERVLTALSYFSEPADLIPDDIPGLGFLDDAIMIEIVCQELKHEIRAYKDFVKDCASRPKQDDPQAASEREARWLAERRAQLHARMRRRRKNQPASNKTKSPFSLF
ncbi:MAG: DUF1232 domain-containing protein [Xanthomonadales bacterium]|nr:DUF1232 domain-containing protein [Xanthomonadales bacterium]